MKGKESMKIKDIRIGDTVTYWSEDFPPCVELTGIVEYDYDLKSIWVGTIDKSKKICEEYGVSPYIELEEVHDTDIINVIRNGKELKERKNKGTKGRKIKLN